MKQEEERRKEWSEKTETSKNERTELNKIEETYCYTDFIIGRFYDFTLWFTDFIDSCFRLQEYRKEERRKKKRNKQRIANALFVIPIIGI